ncbi:MAG: GvpL/GvpF family gas vesicle protein [Devosia sp.]
MTSQNAAAMPASQHYIYGIVAASSQFPEALSGLEDAPVRPYIVDRLAALISPTSLETVRPERRHLSAHQSVLTKVAQATDVLPMAFGMISDSEAAVGETLTEYSEVFSRELARIAGRVEMTVRLRLQGDDIFRMYVEQFPELKRRRDACFSGPREPNQMELLDLGQHFERLLTRDREEKIETAMSVLRPIVSEIKSVEPHDERLMFSIACLIDRGIAQRFDSAIEELASKYRDDYRIEVNGPWPPYSFVGLSLQEPWRP